MLFELVTAGIIVGQYIYHRLTEGGPPKPTDRIEGPRLAEGSAMPFWYGRCLLKTLVVAWYGNATAEQRVGQPDGSYDYTVMLVFVLGIPFFDGQTTLHEIYMGDKKLDNNFGSNWPPSLGGNPLAFIANNSNEVGQDSPEFTEIFEGEFGDGNSSQTMTGTSTEGALVLAGNAASDIPGFRGYATLYMRVVRFDPSLPTFSIEASTYPIVSALPGSPGTQTDDPNPVDVLYDLHTSPFKLAMDPALIDLPSWQAAAQTLYSERHGYSRPFADGPQAQDVIADVLRQADGVIDEDPATGTLRLKLIRADFDPATIPVITPDNCERLENFAAGGWTDLPNKIRVVYTARDDGYRDGSATADNQANAVGQDGIEREVVLQFPGCNTPELAQDLAARELDARSRPIAKMTAIVDRSFWRTMNGDAIAVNWPALQISGRVFRVGNVNRGPANSNTIALDLIEDFFYTHRFQVTDTGGLPSHPRGAVG